jgi:hypothetical protein
LKSFGKKLGGSLYASAAGLMVEANIHRNGINMNIAPITNMTKKTVLRQCIACMLEASRSEKVAPGPID